MQRAHPRLAKDLTVWYRLPWSRVWHQAKTRDISPGGLSFQIRGLMWWTGLAVDVEVQLPDSAFRTRARVARTRIMSQLREIGVCFTDLPRYASDELRKLAYAAG